MPDRFPIPDVPKTPDLGRARFDLALKLRVQELLDTAGVPGPAGPAGPAGADGASPIGEHTVWLPSYALLGSDEGLTNGAAKSRAMVGSVLVATMDFPHDSTKYGQFNIRLPKSYDGGPVAAEFVWTHGATTTNFGVSWGLQAVAAGNDDAIGGTMGTAQYVVDTGGTTDDEYTSGRTPDITLGGSYAAGDWVTFQIIRKHDEAGDTMAILAKLIGLSLFFSTNAATDD